MTAVTVLEFPSPHLLYKLKIELQDAEKPCIRVGFVAWRRGGRFRPDKQLGGNEEEWQ